MPLCAWSVSRTAPDTLDYLLSSSWKFKDGLFMFTSCRCDKPGKLSSLPRIIHYVVEGTRNESRLSGPKAKGSYWDFGHVTPTKNWVDLMGWFFLSVTNVDVEEEPSHLKSKGLWNWGRLEMWILNTWNNKTRHRGNGWMENGIQKMQ